MKFAPLIYLVAFFVLLLLVSACTPMEPSAATPSNDARVSETSEQQKQTEILATATHAAVDASTKNWDATAADDGLVVYPKLKDTNDETVKFEGVPLTVDMEIWTTKRDDNFNEVKDRMIYSGSGTITSWKDGNFLYNGGIKVPYTDIKAIASDSDYGQLYVKIHTPDAQVFEAKSLTGVRIKPEPV